MIISVFAELWYPKSGKKCQFLRLSECYHYLNFFLDYKFEIQNLKSILRHICINYQHIWSLSSAENVPFITDQIIITDVIKQNNFLFLQYFLSLSSSIITREVFKTINRPSDYINKLGSIKVVSQITCYSIYKPSSWHMVKTMV